MLAINLAYFGAVGLVVVHAGRGALAPLRDRRLCYLGQISYGIYLYHHIIFMTADQIGFGGRPGGRRGEAGGELRGGGALVGVRRAADPRAEGPVQLRPRARGESVGGARDGPARGRGGVSVMDDRMYVYATAALIVGLVLSQVMRRSFDPFAPIWLFLVGYVQVYVIQAISYREWAIRVRGDELVTTANARALWALAWFLVGLLLRDRPVDRGVPAPAAGALVVVADHRVVAGPDRSGACSARGSSGARTTRRDVGRGEPAPLVPDRDARRRHPPDRDRPARRAAAAGATPGRGWASSAALRADLDVQRQAVALADRRADDGLRLLHVEGQAAVEAGPGSRRPSPAPWSSRSRSAGGTTATTTGRSPASSSTSPTSTPRRSSPTST